MLVHLCIDLSRSNFYTLFIYVTINSILTDISPTYPPPGHHQLSVCEAYYVAMLREVGNLNPYALDYPVCTEDQTTPAGRARKYGRSQRTWLMNHMLPGLFTSKDSAGALTVSTESEQRLSEVRKSIGLEPVDSYEPCAEDYMTQYLNQDSVKAALHVNKNIVWADCSTTLR